jgi:hypothetical protein
MMDLISGLASYTIQSVAIYYHEHCEANEAHNPTTRSYILLSAVRSKTLQVNISVLCTSVYALAYTKQDCQPSYIAATTTHQHINQRNVQLDIL